MSVDVDPAASYWVSAKVTVTLNGDFSATVPAAEVTCTVFDANMGIVDTAQATVHMSMILNDDRTIGGFGTGTATLNLQGGAAGVNSVNLQCYSDSANVFYPRPVLSVIKVNQLSVQNRTPPTG